VLEPEAFLSIHFAYDLFSVARIVERAYKMIIMNRNEYGSAHSLCPSA
jgi:hypothetical protein